MLSGSVLSGSVLSGSVLSGSVVPLGAERQTRSTG
ncbi:MAG: hypothetical protein ACRDY0_01505 [Acidimicrobiales bacterium]